MQVKVKRYQITHNGQLYKAGDVMEMEDKLAKRLVAKSNGTLEIVDRDEIEYETAETTEEETEDSGGCGLPDVDTLAAVGGRKNKK